MSEDLSLAKVHTYRFTISYIADSDGAWQRTEEKAWLFRKNTAYEVKSNIFTSAV